MSRLLLFSSVSFCLGIVAPAAAADPTMQDLIAEAGTDSVRMVVNASAHTLGWVNARLEVEGKPLLFCQPRDKVTTVDEYISLLKNWVAERDYIAVEGIHSFPRHLLDALVEAYPC